MFKERFIRLCNRLNESPTSVCKKVGLSNAAFANWDDASIPRRATLIKIADYFGVTVDYLLGNTDEKEKPLSEEEPIPEGMLRVSVRGRNGKMEYADFSPEQAKLIESMIAAQKKERQ